MPQIRPIGPLIMLILIVMLSQWRCFDYLTETLVGRSLLFVLILLLARSNRMMGLVGVIAVVLAYAHFNFNVHSYNYYDAHTYGLIEGMDVKQEPLPTLPEEKKKLEKNKGVEGFCMSDKESNILKGKQSNTIPVFASKTSDDVSPADAGTMYGDYANF